MRILVLMLLIIAVIPSIQINSSLSELAQNSRQLMNYPQENIRQDAGYIITSLSKERSFDSFVDRVYTNVYKLEDLSLTGLNIKTRNLLGDFDLGDPSEYMVTDKSGLAQNSRRLMNYPQENIRQDAGYIITSLSKERSFDSFVDRVYTNVYKLEDLSLIGLNIKTRNLLGDFDLGDPSEYMVTDNAAFINSFEISKNLNLLLLIGSRSSDLESIGYFENDIENFAARPKNILMLLFISLISVFLIVFMDTSWLSLGSTRLSSYGFPGAMDCLTKNIQVVSDSRIPFDPEEYFIDKPPSICSPDNLIRARPKIGSGLLLCTTIMSMTSSSLSAKNYKDAHTKDLDDGCLIIREIARILENPNRRLIIRSLPTGSSKTLKELEDETKISDSTLSDNIELLMKIGFIKKGDKRPAKFSRTILLEELISLAEKMNKHKTDSSGKQKLDR
jgi:DNA-binding HxlR family transcriptional regulator